MGKPVIDEKKRIQLEKLLNGAEQDVSLAIKIVDSCNIPVSFVELLCLISAKYDLKYTMATPLIISKNFQSYLIMLLGNEMFIPNIYSMDFIIRLWQLHCQFHEIPRSKREKKYIVKNYRPTEKERFGNPMELNPKANVNKHNS